jgi:RND family efflux transporter MFP subunit
MKIDDDLKRRILRTSIVVVVAIFLGSVLWWHYMLSPWTRDGRVSAEVVDVAAQIPGQVISLNVSDNQFVHKGEVLTIEPENYRLALAASDASAQSREADVNLRQMELERRKKLGIEAISQEETQISQNGLAVAQAAYQEALATRDVAKLNFSWTTVHSPANGYVTNLRLRVGDYAMPGQTKLSIIDSDSFWIAGYFEETKLPRIQEGDYAKVKLMGVGPIIEGHVESFSRGIADTNANGNALGLANVDPIFTWVRLAQRIPVRIHIDRIPKGVNIAAGMTCTIVIEQKK